MNRDDFFKPSLVVQRVTLPNDDAVHVRKLSADEVRTMRRSYMTDESKQLDGLCYIVARCVMDADGRRTFEDGDAAKLAAADFDVIQTIAAAVLAFSGLNDPKAKPAG